MKRIKRLFSALLIVCLSLSMTASFSAASFSMKKVNYYEPYLQRFLGEYPVFEGMTAVNTAIMDLIRDAVSYVDDLDTVPSVDFLKLNTVVEEETTGFIKVVFTIDFNQSTKYSRPTTETYVYFISKASNALISEADFNKGVTAEGSGGSEEPQVDPAAEMEAFFAANQAMGVVSADLLDGNFGISVSYIGKYAAIIENEETGYLGVVKLGTDKYVIDNEVKQIGVLSYTDEETGAFMLPVYYVLEGLGLSQEDIDSLAVEEVEEIEAEEDEVAEE